MHKKDKHISSEDVYYSDPVVAFLDGYEWLHGDPETVTVYIKRISDPIFANVNAQEIIDEVKSAIKIFIKDKGWSYGKFHGNITTLYNT